MPRYPHAVLWKHTTSAGGFSTTNKVPTTMMTSHAARKSFIAAAS